jgi:drug/metabolite transporter (DMT)-like permease
VGTALGWVLYYGLIHRLGAQRASLSMYLAPIASVAIGVAVGGDALRVVTVAGLTLVLLGSWIAAGAGGRAVSSGAPPPPP